MRQRQRLIDACISAMHLYGSSRTTVEKVVSLAQLSPGIVRFYFDSKDAMLVASLGYLAAEFEERVMLPVTQLRDTPVQALQRLVELYLDPEIASPRKVSVWYSFWGEASSRQEYYDICGRKDDDFAALVHELVSRLIARTGAAHLDADGVALGLIGVLEVLWQNIAFQSEAQIDREASRGRAMAYLRSVFPGQFEAGASGAPGAAVTAGLPSWAYSDARLQSLERASLFRHSWQLLGHVAQLARPGDFLSGDSAAEAVVVVRDEKNLLRAFRNECRRRPHALVEARQGHFAGIIGCAPHELTYALDGRLLDGATPGGLVPLALLERGGLILVRSQSQPGEPAAQWSAAADLRPGETREFDVAADWKLVVEQWLDVARPAGEYLEPNHLLCRDEAGVWILRVIPVGAARSRLQYLPLGAGGARRRRLEPDTAARLDGLRQQIALAESIQSHHVTAPEAYVDAGPVTAALAHFRERIAALLPGIQAAT